MTGRKNFLQADCNNGRRILCSQNWRNCKCQWL